MTDDPKPLELLQEIKAELHAANARRIAEIEGPNGSHIEFWTARGRLLLTQLFPNGDFEMFRPLDTSNTVAGLIDALRAYLAAAS